MVRSMIAGVAGLKTHQSKLDVIGNNIANVNTWGYKSSSFHFQDSMYATSINGSAGNDLGGGAGGRNASQVGYGTTISSISPEFSTGAPAPSGNPLDCMIDGTGFFLVGNMINGSFQNVADSGLSLSRVGIFRVDGNGYLVDNQRNYVYGYALQPDSGVPEKPATRAEYSIKQTKAEFSKDDGTVTIAGITVKTKKQSFEEAIKDWVEKMQSSDDLSDDEKARMANYTVSLKNFQAPASDPNAAAPDGWVSFTLTAKQSGGDDVGYEELGNILQLEGANGADAPLMEVLTEGKDRVAGTEAAYSDELSTIRIPIDPDTGDQYEIQSYKINEDGTIIGVDNQNRAIAIGQLALVTVENPNGLEKTDGYYYSVGPNAGDTIAIKANGGPAGKILGNMLEMANVDLANEFSQMITTQRGYQANSKIITVTDQMLEELVNMKR